MYIEYMKYVGLCCGARKRIPTFHIQRHMVFHVNVFTKLQV